MPRIFKAVSIVVHGVVLTILSYVQLSDPGLIPTPRSALAFEPMPIVVKDIPLPPAPRKAPSTPADVSVNTAPIVAPHGVAPETGRESETIDSSARGVVDGIPGGVENLGIGVVPGLPPPPVAPPPPDKPIRVHQGMQAPRKIANVDPIYPTLAVTVRKEGVVILEAVIDAKGNVESVRVLRSIPLLDQAAVTAVEQWRFTPALLDGRPVPVVMTVTVNFALNK